MLACFTKYTTAVLGLAVFVVLPTLAVFQYWWSRRNLVNLAYKIPGPKTYPIVGHAIEFCKDNEKFYKKLCETLKQFTPMCRLWLGPLLFVFLSEPNDLEKILGNPKLVYKSKLYKVLEELYGDGLITNGGEKWRRHRKIITPTFHFKILEQFVDIFNVNSWILVKKLRTLAGDGSTTVTVFPHVALCTLDMICQTAMGVNIEAQQNCESEFVKAVETELRMGHERFLKPWLWNYTVFRLTKRGRAHLAAEKIVRDFTNNIIARKIKEHKEREMQKKICQTDQQLKNDEKGKYIRILFVYCQISY
jgi:cytochrome P450